MRRIKCKEKTSVLNIIFHSTSWKISTKTENKTQDVIQF